MLRARDTTDKGDRGSDKHDSSVPPMIISGNAASNVACSRALGRRQHSWAGEENPFCLGQRPKNVHTPSKIHCIITLRLLDEIKIGTSFLQVQMLSILISQRFKISFSSWQKIPPNSIAFRPHSPTRR